MRQYSHLFSTVHDQTEPVGHLGRGTHYSILRVYVGARAGVPAHFQDFGVVWDEDHDIRVIDVAERMFLAGIFERVRFIGERKGGISLVLSEPLPPAHRRLAESIAGDMPDGDSFTFGEGTIAEPPHIINDERSRVSAFLAGVDAIWQTGPKALKTPTVSQLAAPIPRRARGGLHLGEWYCDTCGGVIESPEDGYVEWTNADALAGDFHIVHHKGASPRSAPEGCYQHEHARGRADVDLASMLGPLGLARLLSKLERRAVPIGTPNAPKGKVGVRDISEWAELVRRLHLPHYERARVHFEQAEEDGEFDGENEFTRMLPEVLEAIADKYGADD